ncbi:hypothetical protein ACWDXD_33760 [Streptomyces sp. NPDC003314]
MTSIDERRMTPKRERIVRQQQPGEWLAGPWTIRETESPADSRVVWEVLHHESKQVLATLPDWAGNLALWIAESHEDIPELLTEIDTLRAKVTEAETAKGDFAAEVLNTTADRIERRASRLGGEWIRADQVVTVLRGIAADRDFTDPAAGKDGAR